ncbi:hypothetical protein ACIOHE_30500 [Streptomyces sp. NPDC087851]|uniref:hypothetical protein n=1 Tax=Streptomyces sp. NPDC087851 TaxID=3365810 RepID=UPI00381A9482
MSKSMGGPTKPEDAQGDAPTRHLLSIFTIFITYWGVTVTLELLGALANRGNCGFRFGPSCSTGQEYLALGPAAFIAGILLSGKLTERVGWQGPVSPFIGVSFVYGSGGASIAFLSGIPRSGNALWVVLLSLFGLLSLGAFVFLVHGFLTGHPGSFKEKLRSYFWILEELPSQQGKRKRIMRERGFPAERGQQGLLVPETPREKAFWRIFVFESCMAVIVGCVVGRIFIHLIAG